MGANGIELPEWVTDKVIERTYRRVQELRAKGENHPATRSLLVRGMNSKPCLASKACKVSVIATSLAYV